MFLLDCFREQVKEGKGRRGTNRARGDLLVLVQPGLMDKSIITQSFHATSLPSTCQLPGEKLIITGTGKEEFIKGGLVSAGDIRAQKHTKFYYYSSVFSV